ncbi:MFS transporter [Mucilaginibacter limnophilus]|uniref:MFS transporter n=1 Tax=Mucilaginibacter limnophilus TaxID=1932778 RepID=UPI00197BE413|nr:MFS transporter [Mucilaginibacter limnophilus]
MNHTASNPGLSNQPSHPIYNIHFGLLCLSSLLFSASFNMLIPEMPAYLSKMGGAEYKGLVIAFFTLTAGISRPFSGKLTDTLGRVPVMAVGSIVCFICGFLYPLLGNVLGFLLLRLVHGFSTGFKPTATAAYVADIVPQERWGEALGIHGISYSTGMAIGPAIGSAIGQYYSIEILFYSSSALALLSILILMNMKETVKNRHRFSFSLLKISKNDIIDVRVLPAGIITLLAYLPYGVILTLVPDWAHHLGIANKGLFFMVFTIASLVIRFVAGKVSDRFGRVSVIKVGVIILVISLLVMAYADTAYGLLIGSVLYGIGSGVFSPAVNAWTVDLSNPEQRGKAMATMYISLEAGIGLGAFFSGLFFHDILSRVQPMFYASAAVLVLSFFYMQVWKKTPYSRAYHQH